MRSNADLKYAEALAADIAAELSSAPRLAGVEAYYDEAAKTHGVRAHVDHFRFEVLMPTPGSIFEFRRNGVWLGGLFRNSSRDLLTATHASPVDVALAMLDRISETV